MLLSELLTDFLGYCRVERGMTKATLITYGSNLRHFLRWANAQGDPAPTEHDFTLALLRRYQYSVSATGVRPRTVRSKVNALRSWGTFLALNNVIEENYALALRQPQKDAPRQDNVSDEECAMLLSATYRIGNARRCRMATAMMSVLIYGALRRQELLDLRTDDVDMDQGSIVIRQGKGQKSRTVWPHKDCLTALRAWLGVRAKAQENWLWPFDTGRPLGHIGLKTLFDEVKAIAGLRDHGNIHPHALRRSCATRLLQQGADIRSVQAVLGHADLATTAMYLATDEKRLRQISALGGLSQGLLGPGAAEPHQTDRETDHGRSQGTVPGSRGGKADSRDRVSVRSGRRVRSWGS